MSHFTVMVFGEDAEKQLAPFQENNMGDCPEQHLKFNDETEYIQKEWDEEDQETKDEYNNDIDAYAEDYHGYKKDEETGKYGYWENPNAKWDWYQLGGRWAGFFKLKPGASGTEGRAGLFSRGAEPGHADAVIKSNIDFEGMRSAAEKEAGEKYDEITSIVGESINDMHSWDHVRDVMFPEDRDLARDFYNSQTAPTKLKEWNSANEYKNSFTDLEDFKVTRDQYCKSRGDSTFSTYAVLKDGVWHQKGDMGWWGMSSNDKEQADWNNEISNLLLDLPEDTLISIYDCHI
jgi:hypothetical protein